MKRFLIEEINTPHFDKEELLYMTGALSSNLGKNKMTAYNDALSIISLRKLNRECGPLNIRINDANVSLYNLINIITIDSCLLTSFPNVTILPLELIFRLDEPYAILREEKPIYFEMEKQYKHAYIREKRLSESLLRSLMKKIEDVSNLDIDKP